MAGTSRQGRPGTEARVPSAYPEWNIGHQLEEKKGG